MFTMTKNFAALALLVGLVGHGALAFAADMPMPDASPQGTGFSFITGDRTPAVTEKIKASSGVEQKPGAQVPLDASFVDDHGNTIALNKYFQDGKPVILQLGYFRCPMLCGVVSQKVVDSLNQIPLIPGKDFHFVYISIDPSESWELARDKKQSYLKQYLHSDTGADGWHLLTGRREIIDRVAQATGFHYLKQGNQYAHAGVLIICTPEGRVARYLSLSDNQMEPETLRLSLVEASAGKLGSIADVFFLTCFHYDGNSGKYSFFAMNLMRIGGLLTMSILGVFLVRSYSRGSRPHRNASRFEVVSPADSSTPRHPEN